MERSNNIMSLSPSPTKRLGVVEVASRWRRGGIGVQLVSGHCQFVICHPCSVDVAPTFTVCVRNAVA